MWRLRPGKKDWSATSKYVRKNKEIHRERNPERRTKQQTNRDGHFREPAQEAKNKKKVHRSYCLDVWYCGTYVKQKLKGNQGPMRTCNYGEQKELALPKIGFSFPPPFSHSFPKLLPIRSFRITSFWFLQFLLSTIFFFSSFYPQIGCFSPSDFHILLGINCPPSGFAFFPYFCSTRIWPCA